MTVYSGPGDTEVLCSGLDTGVTTRPIFFTSHSTPGYLDPQSSPKDLLRVVGTWSRPGSESFSSKPFLVKDEGSTGLGPPDRTQRKPGWNRLLQVSPPTPDLLGFLPSPSLPLGSAPVTLNGLGRTFRDDNILPNRLWV